VKDNLSPHDWQELSAYLDQQLKAERKARLERRLGDEPALRSALQDLRWTKSVLRSQQPLRATRNFTLTPEMIGSKQKPPAYPVLRLVAALASLVLIVLLVGDFLSNQISPAPLSIAQQAQLAQPEAAGALSKSALYPGSQTEIPTFETSPLALAKSPADTSSTEILSGETQTALQDQTGVPFEAPLGLGAGSYTETPEEEIFETEMTAPSAKVARTDETATAASPLAAAPLILVNTPTDTFTTAPGERGVAGTSAKIAGESPTGTATPTFTFTVTPTITSTLDMTPTPTITPTLTLTPTPSISTTLELALLPTEVPFPLLITPLPTDTPTATPAPANTRIPGKKATKTASAWLTAMPTEPLEAAPLQVTEPIAEIPPEAASLPAGSPAPLFPSEAAPSSSDEVPSVANLQPRGTYPFPTAPANPDLVQIENVTPRIFGIEQNQWRGLEILAALIALGAGIAWLILRRRY
jgi:hypothetical protein